MFKALSNLFGPQPQHQLRENGFYVYKHRGKSRYGEFIEIYYIVIFKKLPWTTDEGSNYMVYLTAEFDSDLNFKDISGAHKLINSYTSDDLMIYHRNPEGYNGLYCKLDNKNNIGFVKDTLFDILKIGEMMTFEGFLGDNYLRLTHLVTGYDESDKLITEKIYDLAKFDFKSL